MAFTPCNRRVCDGCALHRSRCSRCIAAAELRPFVVSVTPFHPHLHTLLPCIAPKQVQALASHGHQVVVIAGKPADHAPISSSSSSSSSSHTTPQPHPNAAAPPPALLEVPLPTWARLDRGCAWQAFAAGCGAPEIVSAVAAFRPEAVLGVDWHSLPAYRTLLTALSARAPAGLASAAPPYIYNSYRVYLRTAEEGDEAAFMREAEGAAAAAAALTTCLSRSDAAAIARDLGPAAGGAGLHIEVGGCCGRACLCLC
jgi:hypothetical protein